MMPSALTWAAPPAPILVCAISSSSRVTIAVNAVSSAASSARRPASSARPHAIEKLLTGENAISQPEFAWRLPCFAALAHSAARRSGEASGSAPSSFA
jgi:hypothetical protein